jgi:undecaprenyl-diphosphatase
LALAAAFIAAALLGGPTQNAEAALMEWIAEVRADQPGLVTGIAALTLLGGASVTLTVAGVAALGLIIRRMPGRALLLTMTVLLERLMVDSLKEWIGRPRPPLEPALIHSLAFPSGHSANSMTAFLATALVACPPARRRQAAIAAVCISLIVGLTRIGLGVHWPSDVLGGWALGLLSVGAALLIGERSGLLRLEPQHQIVGGHRLPSREDEAA